MISMFVWEMSKIIGLGSSYRIVLIILFLSMVSFVSAQEFTIRGYVVDINKKGLNEVEVEIVELNKWTLTDSNGYFEFNSIKKGDYELWLSSLSYAKKSVKISLDEQSEDLFIVIERKSLALKEIVVTAETSKEGFSSITINQSAINHLQASSLEDILQLVPGNLSDNPSLSKANVISFREINIRKDFPDETSSLGTAIFVDGMQLCNDVNLQYLSVAMMPSTSIYNSYVASGFDLRSIPSSNIESIEVVKGVSSAEFGEILTGAVLVKTKAGYSPFNVSIKTDPNTKSFILGQGFVLKNDNGTFNYDVDYTTYIKDLRTKSGSYNRIYGTLRYSKVYNKRTKPFSLNLKANYSHSKDMNEKDKDAIGIEKNNFESNTYNFSVFGRINIDKSFISDLKYSLNSSYSSSNTQIVKLQSLSGLSQAAFYSMENSEYVIPLLNNEYYSDVSIEGRPLYVNMKLLATLFNREDYISSKFIYGLESKYKKNIGKGKTFDFSRPNNPNAVNALRPRSFSDIPALFNCSFFAEEKLSIPIKDRALALQFGLRINKFIDCDAMTIENKLTLEPRINAGFFLFKSFNLRAGWGINYKNPTLAHLYPDNAYMDKETFNNGEMYVGTTKVIKDIGDPNIRPAKNTKTEFGFDFEKLGFKVNVTGFYELIEDCFSFSKAYDLMSYNRYFLVGKANDIQYFDGVLSMGGEIKMPHVTTDFNEYNRPTNSHSILKKGIEYSIDLGILKSLNTSLLIDGAYFYNERTTEIATYNYTNSELQSNRLAKYPAGKKNITSRFNTNFRFVTHIPELRMIFSLTSQVLWFEKYKLEYDAAYFSQDGKQVLVNPIAYIDNRGKEFKIQEPDISSSDYKILVLEENAGVYRREKYPPLAQFNFKLSKEIGDNFNLSLYVNNLLNYKQRYKLTNKNSYIYRNQSLFFGFLLKISI